MSHKAVRWLSKLPASATTSGQFRVLFFLCDAHNSNRDPDLACFPSQMRLREATGLSNGGLNNALTGLENAGLIRRRRSRKADGTLGPTFYILGCDIDEPQEPSPQSGDGAISTFCPSPSPHSAPFHLHRSGDEPVKKPVREPCARKSRVSAQANSMGLAKKQAAPALASGLIEQLAEWINTGAVVPPIAVTNTQRDELLARGLVTLDRLRALQIY